MTWPQILVFFLFPAAGYLIGSIPFAWVIGKAHGIDIRTTGSKNIGATNLGRTLGGKYFWQAFLLDAAKGFVPVLAVSIFVWRHNAGLRPSLTDSTFDLLAKYLSAFEGQGPLPNWAPLLTAAACFLGHLFPVYLRFKGGKGVATSFGVVLGFWPLFTLAGLIAGLFFVFMLLVYRYISLASMSAAIVFAGLVAWLGAWSNPYVDTYLAWRDRAPLIAVAAFFAAMIVWRHRANIARLLRGTEPKIGRREIEKSKLRPSGEQAPPRPPKK